MLPSSRTPEGDSFRCSLCGRSHYVEPSIPPGDLVCPSCGSHAWIANEPLVEFRAKRSQLDDSQAELRAGVRAFVSELGALCSQAKSLDDVGACLVSGAVRFLNAHGGDVWIAASSGSSGQPATVRRIASVGTKQLPDLAQEVASINLEIIRNVRTQDDEALLIGVPIRRDSVVVGAITVTQRPGSSPTVQKGYLRFLDQLTQVVAMCPHFNA